MSSSIGKNVADSIKVSTQFKVGDKVSWMGTLGVVVEIEDHHHSYPIRVNFGPFIKDGAITQIRFLPDGKFYDWHHASYIVKI